MSNWFKFVLMATAAFSVSLSMNASAAKLNYDYIEWRYVDTEIDDTNIDGDGFEIGGSFRINENYFAVGSYTDLDFDFGIDGTLLQLGAGYIHAYNNNVDLVGQAQFVDADVDPGDSDSGFALAFGARGHAMPRVELRGFFNYIDIDDSDSFVEFAADYYITDRLVAGGSFDLGGDTDTITFGIRYYLDR